MTGVTHEDLSRIQEQGFTTAAKVSALEAQFSTFLESWNRVEQSLLNKPPIWNMANVLVLVVACCGGLFGIINLTSGVEGDMKAYVDLRLAGLEETERRYEEAQQRRAEKLDLWMADKDAFQRETHYEFGVQVTKNEQAAEQIKHLDVQHHDTQANVIELQKRSAASEVSRRAIGDYVKSVDEHGTRAVGGG